MQLANERMRLIVTSKCNLDCFYCHNEGQAKGSAFMSRDGFSCVLAGLSTSSVSEVTVSGGEPLLHPDLPFMVGALRSQAARVTLVSNGVLLTPSLLGRLADGGLSKFRLGLDSLRPGKPRPSKGYLSSPFDPEALVDLVLKHRVPVDLNVVLTKFNVREVGPLVRLAVDRGLNIKFFEHVEVGRHGSNGVGGMMSAHPQVPEQEFFSRVDAALDHPVEFAPTVDFGSANLAAHIGDTEIRYCRYLCPFGLCWITGTRVDAEGFVYTCMANRGLDWFDSQDPDSGLLTAAAESALRRPCRSGAED